ncbi:MAG: transporter associated domain-containing protein, partial [Spirochaetota bacterium]
YISLKDVLPYRLGIGEIPTLKSLLHPVHLVPETKNLLDLLKEMTEKSIDMAVVIDEYGGTSGIVTFQHLVQDFLEFFYPSEIKMVKQAEGVYLVPGQFELETLQELLNVTFESDNRTLAGFLMERLEEIPTAGTQVNFENYLFTVKKALKNRILEIEIRRVS